MWFKNLCLYRFYKPLTQSVEQIQEDLQKHKFRPCGKLEMFSYGLISPVDKKHDELFKSIDGYLMVCAQKEEKVLPASVVREYVDEKVQEIEDTQMRKVRKKEKEEIREEVLHDLTTKAFTKTSKVYAYFDLKNNWLIVDSASRNKAEELTVLLRNCLGSLPVEPPKTHTLTSNILTSWMTENPPPADFSIENECELRDLESDGGIIRCKNIDLTSTEITNHLEAGKSCTRLALNWDEKFSFLLCDDLSVKRIKYDDLVLDQAEQSDDESVEAQFDADFSIMAMEISNFLPRLMEIHGGAIEKDSGLGNSQ
ncbi:MAG: recombination-associated protein RdgC [Methylococcales bacterium]|jgi:recombination associated protein RdgC|nr:recombination-associated protein RdgC [Methylococcales bacterium]MBT7408245.1 recombination-associated protein RdgC [Methylococcales bacterium]